MDGLSSSFDNILNALQFSYAMNFDDADLWLKIYEALHKQLEKCKQESDTDVFVNLRQLMKMLSILEMLAPTKNEENETKSDED